MISEGTTEIADFIYSLKKQIEDKRFENDRLRKRVQESLQQTGQPYHKEMEACVKASINATVWQSQLTATERMSAVKDDIALPIKTQKYAVANDKNCERKNLLTTLQIGLNVLNLGGGLACVEFVVHAMRIVTNYNTKTEQFSLLSIEPTVSDDVLRSMQNLLQETNDICGLLSTARKQQRL